MVKSVKFLLPNTAALAIGFDAKHAPKGVTVEVRGARYGKSYVVTATPAAARTLAEKLAERASPDLPRGEGQPSSWGHGSRKALGRVMAALETE